MNELDDDTITTMYNDFLYKINYFIQHHNAEPLAIAAILITQGLSIYKTTLTDEEYDIVVENIAKTKDIVSAFHPTPDTRNLH
jgi:hypothetical protein